MPTRVPRLVTLFSELLLVVGQGLRLVELFGIVRLYLDQPALAEGVGLQRAEVVAIDAVVDGRDLAADRAYQVADGLHAFDFAEGLALGDLVALFGQVDESQVVELFNGEVGDADRDGPVLFKPAPFGTTIAVCFVSSGFTLRVPFAGKSTWYVMPTLAALAGT
jgi:hypothetical protein